MHFKQPNLIVAALLILPGITNTSQEFHNTQAMPYNYTYDYTQMPYTYTQMPYNYDYTHAMPHKNMSYQLYLRPDSPFAENNNSHWSDVANEPNQSRGGKTLKRPNKRPNRRSFDRIAIEAFGRSRNIKKLFINREYNGELKKSFLKNLYGSTYIIADQRSCENEELSYENKELVETFDNEGPKFGILKFVQKTNSHQKLPTDVVSKLEKNGCYCITPLCENSFPADLMELINCMIYNYKDRGSSAYVSKNNKAHLSALKQLGYEENENDVPKGCKKLILPEQKLISQCQNSDLPLKKNCPKLNTQLNTHRQRTRGRIIRRRRRRE